MNYEILGAALRRARNGARLTQQFAAEHLNITASNISSWERGKSKIDIASLATLCDLYSISLSAILTEAEKRSNFHAGKYTLQLSLSEKDLVLAYRCASPDDRSTMELIAGKYVKNLDADPPNMEVGQIPDARLD